MTTDLIPIEAIQHRILVLRGCKVLLDNDLAVLYGVSTKALNQAVKRNSERFPEDFVFQLTEEEKREVVTNCDHLVSLKFSPVLPFAFINHGPPALRAGASICGTPLPHTAPDHDETLRELIAAMRSLIAPPQKPKLPIGFHVREGRERYRSKKV